MTRTKDDLRERHAEVFWASLSGFGRDSRRPGSAPILLATEAAKYWAARSGTSPPDMVEGQESEITPPPDAIQQQAAWLDSLSDEDASTYLLSAAATLGLPSDEHASSPSLIEVAVAALMTRAPATEGPVTIIDPAVGSGSMLAAAADAVRKRVGTPVLAGQDISSDVARFAAAALFMAGEDAQVAVGNSLTTDAYRGQQAVFSISSPPFGLSWGTHAAEVEERHRADGWYGFGLPPKSDASWLFASRMLEKLRSREQGGGRAVTFVSPGTAVNNGGDNVRRALIESDGLDLIIALPSGLLGNTTLPLFALVLTNNKASNLEGRVQVIDLRSFYESLRGRSQAQRSLSEKGFEALRRSLSTTKDGPSSRTVPNERLLRRTAQLRRRTANAETTTETASDPPAVGPPSQPDPPRWTVKVPLDTDMAADFARRYGAVDLIDWESTDQVTSILSVEPIFDTSADQLVRQLGQQGWGYTRLSTLLRCEPEVAGELGDPEANIVLLPTGQGPASAGVEESQAVGRVLKLTVDPAFATADFLAGWLNSSTGQASRRDAIRRASTGSVISAVRADRASLLRLADELVVPLAPLRVQAEIAAAQGRLNAAASILRNSITDLWDAADAPSQITSRFDTLLDESLAAWSHVLPAPVASALRALETDRENVHAAHKQVFRVWEAYAAFWGTVLLSALGTDPVRRHEELASIRETLSSQGLAIERATFGSWSVIIQRLSKHFRERLIHDDAEETARVLQAFGGPAPTTLRRLLDPAVIELIAEANAKRNTWDGHSAKLPELQLLEQLTYMDDLLRNLRAEIGSAWLDLRLLRAGDGRRRDGQIVQTVEELIGPTTPFMAKQVRVGELMERDSLYLAADGALEPLRILPLMVLRSGPDSIQDTCFFFNRMEGTDVRLVSYQLTSDGEVSEPLIDVSGAVASLIDG